jgi:hypothetical protein
MASLLISMKNWSLFGVCAFPFLHLWCYSVELIMLGAVLPVFTRLACPRIIFLLLDHCSAGSASQAKLVLLFAVSTGAVQARSSRFSFVLLDLLSGTAMGIGQF